MRAICRSKVQNMAKIYKYIIRIPPITKKNSQRILINQKTRKPFIAQSAAYKRYEAAALWYIYTQNR